MLVINNPHEVTIPKRMQKSIWSRFLDKGTTHSAQAGTLPYIMRRCEEEKIPYRLTAMPGVGYFIEPLPKE